MGHMLIYHVSVTRYRSVMEMQVSQLIYIRMTVNEVNVDDEKLKAVLKFCYLGGMLCF